MLGRGGGQIREGQENKGMLWQDRKGIRLCFVVVSLTLAQNPVLHGLREYKDNTLMSGLNMKSTMQRQE